MKIILEHIAKRFQDDWIFKNVHYEFQSGLKYAITGSNGSGKSTLLKIISGSLTPSEGKLEYFNQKQIISLDNIFKYISFAAPYTDLIEEMNLKQLVHFYQQFKKLSCQSDEFFSICMLENHTQKKINQFSSGMKQRLKIGLAIFSDVPVVLLDEPTSNLDEKGIQWYQKLIKAPIQNRTLIISSNSPVEYQGFDDVLNIEDFKK